MKNFLYETSKRKIRQRAIVVGVQKKGEKPDNNFEGLAEIKSLCRTAGARVVGELTQILEHYNPATMIGSGKVQELAEMAGERRADIVVFDAILSP